MKFLLALSFSFLLMTTLCFGQSIYTYSPPAELEDGWQTADIRSLEVDTTLIYRLFSQVVTGGNKLHSALLVKNDQLVIEEYFNEHSVNKQHDMRSVTKSIRSILLGIAIDKGFIESINDPISKYLKSHSPKKNLDPRKEGITIKHLLTMSSGWDCNDWDKKSQGQEDKVYSKKDWIQFTLDLQMINDPGKVSTYCSMGAILVAEIISQSSGMLITDFADEYLFEPLGIVNVSWDHTSKKEVIPSGKRLYMTSRDLAKIGLLMLNNGRWNNEQIVSEDWVRESTSSVTKITGMEYGYFWWNIPFNINGKVINSITATGNGGQYIMIFPEMDMVAVFTGGAYNSQEDKLPFAIMDKVFLPTFSGK
ncbi:MAG TPA: serine hydrolase [Balneola sp.]|nr:serine hydrolase [Balneola sp.]|tara:strand:+ start:188 stop:1279 length:1092 start_codon:yes stop_codon:yes gene_type:complete